MRFSKILFVCLGLVLLVGMSTHRSSVVGGSAKLMQKPIIVADGGDPLPRPPLMVDGRDPLPRPPQRSEFVDGGDPLPRPPLAFAV
jgi:hypothetical protein